MESSYGLGCSLHDILAGWAVGYTTSVACVSLYENLIWAKHLAYHDSSAARHDIPDSWAINI